MPVGRGGGVKGLIRVAAIVFAVVSVVFWQLATSIAVDNGVIVTVRTATSAGYFAQYISYTVPALLYAILCTLFCHWFARRVVKLTMAKGSD
jgi:ABC-type uncharacterized transport system fused permease/ATPase subunit